MLITKKDFGGMENGQAMVCVLQTKYNKFVTVRYLPAGMDICPTAYGYHEKVEDAMVDFERACSDVVGMGYPEVKN